MKDKLREIVVEQDQERWREITDKIGAPIMDAFDDVTTLTVSLRSRSTEGGDTTIAKVEMSLDGDVKMIIKEGLMSDEEAYSLFSQLVTDAIVRRQEAWALALKLLGLAGIFI